MEKMATLGSTTVAATLITLLLLIVSAPIPTQAESLLPVGDKMCLDLDSINLVKDARGELLVTASVELHCDVSYSTHLRQLWGIKREECPAVLARKQAGFARVYAPSDNVATEEPPVGVQVNSFGQAILFHACRRKGEPDGIVVFENEILSDHTAVVYLDNLEVCRIAALFSSTAIVDAASCEVDLRRFREDSDVRHRVRIVVGAREVNDTVSVSDCHWNLKGTKIFYIRMDKVRFDCM